jgi:hypothetical protein
MHSQKSADSGHLQVVALTSPRAFRLVAGRLVRALLKRLILTQHH